MLFAITFFPLIKDNLIFKSYFHLCIGESSHTRLYKVGAHTAPSPWVSYTSPGAGVFQKTPREAWETQNFQLREGVADWPLFCQTDISTHTLKVRSHIYISMHLYGRKERDLYPSYAMTIILLVNHVYKIE